MFDHDPSNNAGQLALQQDLTHTNPKACDPFVKKNSARHNLRAHIPSPPLSPLLIFLSTGWNLSPGVELGPGLKILPCYCAFDLIRLLY